MWVEKKRCDRFENTGGLRILLFEVKICHLYCMGQRSKTRASLNYDRQSASRADLKKDTLSKQARRIHRFRGEVAYSRSVTTYRMVSLKIGDTKHHEVARGTRITEDQHLSVQKMYCHSTRGLKLPAEPGRSVDEHACKRSHSVAPAPPRATHAQNESK